MNNRSYETSTELFSLLKAGILIRIDGLTNRQKDRLTRARARARERERERERGGRGRENLRVKETAVITDMT